MSRNASQSDQVRWAVSGSPVDYPNAVTAMAREVDAIARGTRGELVWLLEHPPLLTAGPRAKREHLLRPGDLPIFETGRGGELTYHGPGQRIAYVLLDVRQRAGGDVRAFVRCLENTVIGALDRLGVSGRGDPDRPGVWVPSPEFLTGDAKIAALGLRVQRGISSHGISLNVAPDLDHFSHIVPCGLDGSGVTSLAALGKTSDMAAVDNALHAAFTDWLGPLMPASTPV